MNTSPRLTADTRRKLKSLAQALGVYRLVRIVLRRRLARQYYADALKRIEGWAWKDTEDSNFYYRLTPLNEDQLAQTVKCVTGCDLERVRSYFAELDGDAGLREHIRKALAQSNYGRDIQVEFGRRLGWYAMVRALKPKLVVETGVDHGVGSCVLASALLRNAADGCPGRYIGTDIRQEAGQLLQGPYRSVAEIVYGDSIQSLKDLQGSIDLFINDSDHSADYEAREYETVAGKLSPSAVILGDNSHVTDKLSRFSATHGRRFIFFREIPQDHWYPGAGIGISFPSTQRDVTGLQSKLHEV